MRNALSILACALVAGCSASSDARDPTSTVAAPLGAAPHAELDFLPGWTQAQHGAIVRGGHVDVRHDASRLSKCAAPTIFAFARFSPGGQTYSSDEAFGFDVPADATSVALWFHAVAPGCDEWDSNFGSNWTFPVIARAPSDVGWVGDWGSSTNRACTHAPGVPQPITIDEYMRERACIFVDVDVWVPGVTDVAAPHPEYIAATATWAKDTGAPVTEALAYQGIVGHNARFRWQVPYEIRSMADWTTASYAFSFISDGVHATRAAQPSGDDWTIVRAFRFSSSP